MSDLVIWTSSGLSLLGEWRSAPGTTETFDSEQLENVPVIAGDDVGAYCASFTDDVDVAEVVSRESIGLVSGVSPVELADQIAKLIDTPKMAEEMGARARALGEGTFRPALQVKELESAYGQFADGQKAAGARSSDVFTGSASGSSRGRANKRGRETSCTAQSSY